MANIASPAGRRHPVTLLAPSGREQPVILVVAREGLQLTTVDGKVINTFAYETIRKWLPSHLRSKNPGPDDCLDIQIETDKGPRDLRMRCASVTAVKQLMKDLRDTVETIMRDMDDRQLQQQDIEAQGQQPHQQIRELPSIAATVPAARMADAAMVTPAAQQRLSSGAGHSNAETQTPDDPAPAQQHQQPGHPQAPYDGHAPASAGAPAPLPQPLFMSAPAGGGVAQLFVAHPTGVALPVNARGLATPALLEGLQQATAPVSPLLVASGGFPYEFLDQYGASVDMGDTELTDRASSAATGFVNTMFQQPRHHALPAGVPLYGVYSSQPSPSLPPHSPPLSPGMPSAGASSGGYYPQSLELHLQQQQQAHTIPSPQMYYTSTAMVPPQGADPASAPRPPVYVQQQQQHQQHHGLPPQYPPMPRGSNNSNTKRGAHSAPGGRPLRRSDPASTSPVRRRVEFSGVGPGAGGGASDSELSDVAARHYAPYRHDGGRHGPEHHPQGSSGDSVGTSERGSGDSDEVHARGHDSGGEGSTDLYLKVKFLEDLVARLSAEVSRRNVTSERATATTLALAGASETPVAAAPAATQSPGPAQPVLVQAALATPSPPPVVDYEGLLSADALGAAAVLRDQKLLSPLLSAYDTRISQLEADLRSRTEQVQALKGQVDEVVEENDRLRGDLTSTTEARDAATAQANSAATALLEAKAAAAAATAAGAGNTEELELLKRENELLLSQQSDMDAEIQRLHRQLQERVQDAMRMSQEQAALLAQTQQASAKAQDAEGRANKLADGLRAAEAKAAALASQMARNKAALDEANTTAATTKAALDELRLAHSQLQSESAAAQQRYKVASDGAASLQLELSTARERSDALQIQVSALTRECETLRSALSGVEGKLTELQRRDADVWTRVKESMTAAEEARLARDTAQARCLDLERQVELANTRLNTVRQATRDTVVDEFNTQINAAHAATAQVREELVASQTAVSEWRARAERLERDQASLMAELAALREDTAVALASKNRLGLASLGAVEKVAALERERDEAVAKLESAQRKAERVARDAQMERQSMEHTLRGLKSTIAELETSLAAARAEATNTKRQLEAASRELAATKTARQQSEMELRQQMAALRAEREADMRTFTSRLQAQVTAASAAAAEAERLLSNKQEVLARWREEAQTLASRMEAALSEHKRELSAKGHEAAELRSRVDALSAENVKLATTVSELEAKIDDLNGHLADADARADAAAAQLMGATNREADLQQELRQLQVMLDRSQFEKNRMQRAHDPLTAKYDALKKDIRQAVALPMAMAGAAPGTAPQHPVQLYINGSAGASAASNGWAGSPDGVVHASRLPRSHQHHYAHGVAPGR